MNHGKVKPLATLAHGLLARKPTQRIVLGVGVRNDRRPLSDALVLAGSDDGWNIGLSPRTQGFRDAREALVKEHHELVAMLETDGASRETIKRTAVARQIVAVGEHLMREAKLDPRNVGEWLPASWLADVEAHVSEMPYLSRVSQVHFARLRNRSLWRSNDLLDIHFLSAGAAYASVVAGEKRTIGDMRTARDVPSGAKLATSLCGVVDALQG